MSLAKIRERKIYQLLAARAEGLPLLHCMGSTLYSVLFGLPAIFKAKSAGQVLRWFRGGRKSVVFFCAIPSHYQNIIGIPAALKLARPDLNVIVIAKFTQSECSIGDKENVPVIYGLSEYSARWFRADLFATAWVGFSRCAAPMGSRSIHMLHSLVGVEGVYQAHHFDSCDYVFCASAEQELDFRKLAHKRNLTNLNIVRGGYPKLDLQIEQSSAYEFAGPPTIVYAPTLVYSVNEGLATLVSHGAHVIQMLLNHGFRVVFRPHPISFNSQLERDAIHDICGRFASDTLFSLDTSKNYTGTYSSVTLMITDLSGTGFTFALSQGRPAIFFAPNEEAEAGLDGVHFRDRERIGRIVRNIDDLVPCIEELLKNMPEYSEQIVRYRDETIFNVGRSREAFVEAVGAILEGKESPLIQSMKMPDNA
ncbi:MAG TPA: hypothetical protein DCZ59_06005 [Bacteroidetes bacterium]|nr:hypothetical protein [Bacteroidota bacterium]